jgi:hypothetical protein
MLSQTRAAAMNVLGTPIEFGLETRERMIVAGPFLGAAVRNEDVSISERSPPRSARHVSCVTSLGRAPI